MQTDADVMLRKMARDTNHANNKRRDFRVPRAALPRALADAARDFAAVCRLLAERAPKACDDVVIRLVAVQYEILLEAAMPYRAMLGRPVQDRAERAKRAADALDPEEEAAIPLASRTTRDSRGGKTAVGGPAEPSEAGPQAAKLTALPPFLPVELTINEAVDTQAVDVTTPPAAEQGAPRRRSALFDWDEIDRCRNEQD